MIKFNENERINSINGALKLRGKIEEVVDIIQKKDFDGIYFIGIGGTWASSLQVEVHIKNKSNIPVFVENASEFNTTGNKRFTNKSVVIFSSVTGTTKEIVESLKKAKEIGATIFGFVDTENSVLTTYCDYCISYPMNEQLKFFMVANRLMYNNGDFPEYDKYNFEMENHLANALVDVEKKSDAFAENFAKEKYKYFKQNPQMPHYFIGAGSQWGATYSYAMCYWEEQLWIRTKSISSSEFFHGTLEIIDDITPVTLFISEDSQRSLSERVANFLPNVCRNYTIIDTKDYELNGISTEFRGSISHLVILSVNYRINAHMEKEFCHPMVIRRYYRQFDY